MNSQGKYYYPQLDAVRGLSFLAVYFFHTLHPAFGGSFWGNIAAYFFQCLDFSIDVFFVLSAFLLTRLGLNEYRAKGNFSFGNYFLRRVLRIWPLYYLLMIFSFVVVPYAAEYFKHPVTLPPAAWYLFFVSNFYQAPHVYFLRFLWTLSVEEQFYLVLGLCLLFFPKRLRVIMVALLAGSLIYNFLAVQQGVNDYFNTLTYIFDFAAGALGALLLDRIERNTEGACGLSRRTILLYYAALPLALFAVAVVQRTLSDHARDLLFVFTRLAFIIYATLFIIGQTLPGPQPLRLGRSRFLVYTGKISYGLYCFHGIVLTFGILLLRKLHIGWGETINALLLLAADFALASASYYFYERPFLQLKKKFRRI